MSVNGGNAIDHEVAYKGMPSGQQLSNVVSKVNNGTAVIQYGEGVITSGDDGAVVPSATFTESEFVGITRRLLDHASNEQQVHQIQPATTMSVLTTGEIWVRVLTEVNKDDDVFLIFDGTDAGDFQNVAGTPVVAAQVPGAKFTSSAAANAIAKVSLNIGG